jgi:hypothetical protein
VPNGPSAEQRDLVAFIERDYAIAQEATGSVENAVVASRSIGLTLMAALLGVGLSQKSWAVAGLAAVAGAAVYIIDGYYSWQVEQRKDYLRGLERGLGAYYTAVERAPNNERELNNLEIRLAGVRIGANSQIRQFTPRDLLFNNPMMLFRGLYPVLIVAALVATGIFVAHALRKSPADTSLSECNNGVHLELTSPLQVQVPPGALGTTPERRNPVPPRTFEIVVPTANVECR